MHAVSIKVDAVTGHLRMGFTIQNKQQGTGYQLLATGKCYRQIAAAVKARWSPGAQNCRLPILVRSADLGHQIHDHGSPSR